MLMVSNVKFGTLHSQVDLKYLHLNFIFIIGTHLGHNLPDRKNRYCINLVSVAGRPKDENGNIKSDL